MMKQLWVIVKGVITFVAFSAIVGAAILYVNSTKETGSTLQNDVIPKLNYLVKADSANRSRDEIMQCKIDSTRLVVDALGKTRVVEIVNDSSLTRAEFIEEMRPFMEYIDDIKKNKSQSEHSKLSPVLFDWASHSPGLEEWQIPAEWLMKPSTALKITNRK